MLVIPPIVRHSVVLAVSLAMSLCMAVEPAAAQGLDLIRDTEIERVLKSYEGPHREGSGTRSGSDQNLHRQQFIH